MLVGMAADDEMVKRLKRLARSWRSAEDRLAAARHELAVALLEATEADMPQKDIAAAAGTNRETVRLMVNKARDERTARSTEDTSAPA